MSAIGVSVGRSDGPLKVTGAARYTVDLELPGMLHARVLRSPYPHARIVRLDASAAASLPGIVTLTAADLAHLDHWFGVTHRDQPVLPPDKVRFVGDAVAAVAASRVEDAEAALDLIEVEYEPLPAVLDVEEAILADAPLVHESERSRGPMFLGWPRERFGPSANICSGYHVEQGHIATAFAAADLIFDDVYRVPTIQHGHLEPHAAIAEWQGRQRLTIHTSTQSPSIVREQLAEIFGLAQHQVRVVVPYVGGGYGAKVYAKVEPLAAALAWKARRPVRLVLTREEVFATAVRHAATVRIKTGVMRDGTIVAREVHAMYDTGAYADTGPRVVKKGGYNAGGPYRIPNESLTTYCVYTNKPPAVAFRGFGVPQVCWAYESQMDDIARCLAIDPLELRRRHLVREGDVFISGDRLTRVGIEPALTAAAEAIDWGTPPPATNGHLLRGRGLACSIKSTSTPSNSAASVRLNSDGTAHLLTSSVEIGQGAMTVLAQIVAETLSLTPDQISVSSPDTDLTPFDQSTLSSRTTFSMGRAATEAALEIKRQLLEMASDALEVHQGDLQLGNGRVSVRGTSDRSLTFAEVLQRHFGSRSGSAIGNHVFQTRGGLRVEDGKGHASVTWFYAAAGAEVEVDVETGKVRVVRIATAADVGRAINPVQCHLQNEGSMLTGLGSALFEEMAFQNGQPTNSTFLDYALPSIEDYPEQFRSILLETPSEEGPFGARGVGESVISPLAAAIGNAVANALSGARVRELPLTPERVLAAIDQMKANGGGSHAA